MRARHVHTPDQKPPKAITAVAPRYVIKPEPQSRTKGQIDSVAIESIYHRPQTLPDGKPAPTPTPQPALAEMVKRTDTVFVVATSISDNIGGKPQTLRWNLRLDVSDVDGKLLISRLEQIQ